MCPQCRRPAAVRLRCAISYHGGLAVPRALRPGFAAAAGPGAPPLRGAARAPALPSPPRPARACPAAGPAAPCPGAPEPGGRRDGGLAPRVLALLARLPASGSPDRSPPALPTLRWAPAGPGVPADLGVAADPGLSVGPGAAAEPETASPWPRVRVPSAPRRQRERRTRSSNRSRISSLPGSPEPRPPDYDGFSRSACDVTERNLLRSGRRS